MPLGPKATMQETLIRAPLRLKFCTGAAAGAVAVTGIKKRDILQSVTVFTGSTNLGDTDLTSQFTITADGTIDNTGGTSSVGKVLLVVWLAVPQNADTTT